jgi:hypothetical protein
LFLRFFFFFYFFPFFSARKKKKKNELESKKRTHINHNQPPQPTSKGMFGNFFGGNASEAGYSNRDDASAVSGLEWGDGDGPGYSSDDASGYARGASVSSKWTAKASHHAARVRETASGHTRRLREGGESLKASGHAKMRKVVEDRLEHLSNKVCEIAVAKIGLKLKTVLRDDSMPKFVVRTINGTVDEMLPDLEEELKGKARAKFREQEAEDLGEPRSCFPGCPCWLRNWVLYTLFPFDRTIWQQVRTWSFWLLTLISAVPVYGVHQLFYLMVLLFKDKSDEYQVLSFILSFKGMSFVSQGVIPIIRGSATLYACAVRVEPTCEENAPQVQLFEMGFFVLQVLLVWGAFLRLPFTVKKGRARFKHEDAEEQSVSICCCCTGYAGRGGALRFWIVYDFVAFLLCAGLMAYVVFVWYGIDSLGDDLGNKQWLVLSSLYWIKALYGLLSVPFAVFKMPVMSGLLTHAAATGYSRHGRCLRMMKKTKEKDRIAVQKQLEAWDAELAKEKAKDVEDITEEAERDIGHRRV